MKPSASRRLYPTLPPSPLDGWCQRGLMGLAISGGAACALSLSADHGWWFGIALLYPFLLLFGPFATRWMNFFDIAEKHHRQINQAFYLVVLLSFPFLAPQPTLTSWVLVCLLSLHGYALRYARRNHFAVLALLLPLTELLLAYSILWPNGVFAKVFVSTWLLSTLLLAGGVTTWIHARWSRRCLSMRDRSHNNPAETGNGLWERARFMMLLGLLLFPIGLVLQQAALWAVVEAEVVQPLPPLLSTSSNSTQDVKTALDDVKDASVPTRDFVFPETISFQGTVANATRDALLFQIKSERDLGRKRPYYSAARPLYLTATTFDTLNEKGLSRGFAPEAIFHSKSGLGSDDWIIFDPDFKKSSVFQFKMKTRPILHEQNGGMGHLSYLLHDRRMVAMRYPSCRLDEEDQTALAEPPDSAMFEYQWLSLPVDSKTPLISTERASPRYLSLPRGAEFRPWIADAELLCQDLSTSKQKLQRVLTHFQQDFRYDLNPSTADGIQAFEDFFANRRGYCTYFASAAMLYLRANGIACRVATGFMVTDYSAARQAYIGRLPGHAWVEVLLADGNWRAVEPTPVTLRMDAIAANRNTSRAEDFPADGETDALAAAEVKPNTDADEAIQKTDGSSAFIGVTRGILVISLGMILSIVVFAMLFGHLASVFGQKRERKRKEALFTPEAMLAMDYWARIRELLQELGFHKKRSQTASEFTESVQFWGGDFYKPLNTVTRLVYRTRFGGYIWSEREGEFLDRFESQLIEKSQAPQD
ncbi:MAG: transglutaminase-like domain-containing protein [Planctomycetota bacterium]|nr:transglutaminase-like domain-containing protein [Planctomycetota bacterium]